MKNRPVATAIRDNEFANLLNIIAGVHIQLLQANSSAFGYEYMHYFPHTYH